MAQRAVVSASMLLLHMVMEMVLRVGKDSMMICSILLENENLKMIVAALGELMVVE